jgi:hypothetical protein
MTTYQRELRAQARVALEGNVEVAHSWEQHHNVVMLNFPEFPDGGFRVALEASDTGVVLTAGRMHVPFDDSESPVDDVRDALGLARDLLSDGMRLREIQFLGIPYRWYLESEVEGEWIVEHEMGLLFWIPSFVASSALYQNRHLPRRAV